MLRRLIIRIVMLVALAGALTGVPIASAVAQTTTAELGQTATLIAKGAALQVPVIYTCSPDTVSSNINVFVTERVGGGRIATGSGSVENLICDGTQHTAIITVVANDVAFHQGTAFGQGNLNASEGVNFQGTIRVTNN